MDKFSRGRYTIVCSSAVKELDDILILIDQGGELCGVLALGDELIHGQVRLLAMPMMTFATLATLTTVMLLVIFGEGSHILFQFLHSVGGRV